MIWEERKKEKKLPPPVRDSQNYITHDAAPFYVDDLVSHECQDARFPSEVKEIPHRLRPEEKSLNSSHHAEKKVIELKEKCMLLENELQVYKAKLGLLEKDNEKMLEELHKNKSKSREKVFLLEIERLTNENKLKKDQIEKYEKTIEYERNLYAQELQELRKKIQEINEKILTHNPIVYHEKNYFTQDEKIEKYEEFDEDPEKINEENYDFERKSEEFYRELESPKENSEKPSETFEKPADNYEEYHESPQDLYNEELAVENEEKFIDTQEIFKENTTNSNLFFMEAQDPIAKDSETPPEKEDFRLFFNQESEPKANLNFFSDLIQEENEDVANVFGNNFLDAENPTNTGASSFFNTLNPAFESTKENEELKDPEYFGTTKNDPEDFFNNLGQTSTEKFHTIPRGLF